MGSVFCNARGVIFIDYLEKSKTINSEYYMSLLQRLKEEKITANGKETILFHQGNAPCHKSIKTMVRLHELNFQLLPHPPYSPDVPPSGYWLLADLKQMLAGKRYRSNEKVITGTEAYFEANDKSFYKSSIEHLERCWNDCITHEGEYTNE